MTSDFTGGGDPARTIEILWRASPAPRRGPKPRFTLDDVAAAAIALADAEGLGALSMRRIAERLGVSAMSLYTYVPGKHELLDLIVDTVSGELPSGGRDGDDWRARLEAVARDSLALYVRHPWMLQVAISRPPLGPHIMARYDRELRAVDGIGLTDIEMDLVVQLVGDYVHGAARNVVAATQVEQRTGLTDAQWWERAGPALEKVYPAGAHPVADRVGSAAGAEYNSAGDPERAFAFGLARLIDGVGFLVSRKG